MTFDEILTQVITTLQRQGRVSYGALKRRFDLDDTYLQDVKDELIGAQRIAVDENEKILVWMGPPENTEPEKMSAAFRVSNSWSSQSLAPTPQYSDVARLTLPAPCPEEERGQLVGREEDLRLLLKRWEQVQEGHGQVVLLSGEAGIGKSRLVREFRRSLVAKEVLPFVIRCSASHQRSAFSPVIDLFQRAFRLTPEDSPQDKLNKVERALAIAQFADALPLVAAFLGLPPAPAVLTALPPQKLREQTIQIDCADVVSDS